MFPRLGSSYRVENDWRTTTTFSNSILECYPINECERNPFAVRVVLNRQDTDARTAAEYIEKQAQISGRLALEQAAVSSVMPQVEEIVHAYNELHNRLFAENIGMIEAVRTQRAKAG
jgi:hypothetical protein